MKNFIDISDLSSKALRAIIEEAKSRKIKRIVFCFESTSHLATFRFLQGIGNETLYKNEFIFLFNAISDNATNLDKIYNKYNPDGIIITTGRTRQLVYDISKYNSSNLVLLNCWADNFNGISILPADYHSTKDIIKNLMFRLNNFILLVAIQLVIGGLVDLEILSINEQFKKYF